MSIESQAILAGHFSIDQIVRLVNSEISGKVTVRDMQRPEYKIVEYNKLDGSSATLNIFLNSWAGEDYSDVFTGPSTFMTTEYSPQNFNLVRSITAALGGLARKTEAEPWVELEPARL
jgi:hypothetical protein